MSLYLIRICTKAEQGNIAHQHHIGRSKIHVDGKKKEAAEDALSSGSLSQRSFELFINTSSHFCVAAISNHRLNKRLPLCVHLLIHCIGEKFAALFHLPLSNPSIVLFDSTIARQTHGHISNRLDLMRVELRCVFSHELQRRLRTEQVTKCIQKCDGSILDALQV